MVLNHILYGVGSLSENSVFLEERTATIVSSEGNAKVFYTSLYNYPDCKRALQGKYCSIWKKIEKRHNDVFTARKGQLPAK